MNQYVPAISVHICNRNKYDRANANNAHYHYYIDLIRTAVDSAAIIIGAAIDENVHVARDIGHFATTDLDLGTCREAH